MPILNDMDAVYLGTESLDVIYQGDDKIWIAEQDELP